MKKAMKIMSVMVFRLLFLYSSVFAQKGCIFFYRPYTDSIETNLYQKTKLKFNFQVQYNNIKSADVKFEISNAIKHQDYRFIGISGNSYLYPGLEGGYEKNKDGSKIFIALSRTNQKYVDKYKFKAIMGTSDVINSNQPDLQGVAYDYAKKYNKMLLIKISELKEKRRG